VTPDEKQIITDFVARVVRGDAPPAAPSPWGRAAAQPPAPPREPIDPEADALLRELQEKHPEARYRLAQLAFVQEHALAEAQNRIAQLEWEAQNRGQQQGGLLGGLFGGGNRGPATPPPAPVHAPGYRPGMFQQRPGFLGTAGSVAMGVIGGMLLGSVISSALGLGGTAEAATPADATPTSDSYEDTGVESVSFGDEEL
jgi:hypothetical protein